MRNPRQRQFWLITLPLVLSAAAVALVWMPWWLVTFFAAFVLAFVARTYWLFLVGFSLAAVLSTAWSIWLAGDLVEHARPVRGLLERVDYEKARRRSWIVIPTYSYEYGGRQYRSRAVRPLESFEDVAPRRRYGVAAAEREARRLAANGRPVVYVYERDPSRAYLQRVLRGEDYGLLGAYLVLWAVVGVGAVLLVATERNFTRLPRRAEPGDAPWRELRRATPPTSVQFVLLVAHGASVEAGVAWLVWHYWTHVGGPVSWLTWVPVLLGLFPLVLACGLLIRVRHVREARVWTDHPTPAPGDAIRVRVRQRLSGRRAVESIRIGLVCEHTELVGAGKNVEAKVTTTWAEWVDLIPVPQTMVDVERRFAPPADVPTSTPPGDVPAVRWALQVRTKVRGLIDYERDFIVRFATRTDEDRVPS